MVGGALSRGLAVLAVLAEAPDGRSVQQVADTLDLPKSAAHRILVNLVDDGYARQDPATGDYRLTLRLVTLALRHLARNTLVDLARPVLQRLAGTAGELARLSLVDGDRLIWVAKAQGATSGLKYDPDPGAEARLSCTANGLAWLSGLSDERALELMLRQGLTGPGEYGPNAPTTIEDFLGHLRRARADGYACVVDGFEAGASAVAMPVADRAGGTTVGVLSIAGPSIRFTVDRMLGLLPPLRQACAELTGMGMDVAGMAPVGDTGAAPMNSMHATAGSGGGAE
jgi:DNA-binding IclR family transcriptional regulator